MRGAAAGKQLRIELRHIRNIRRNLSPRDHSSSLNIHMIRPFCDFQTKPKFNFEGYGQSQSIEDRLYILLS